MIYVVLSVICSVLVSVLLKLARRFSVDMGQAVAWNYAVASALTSLVLRPPLTMLRDPTAPWLALAGLGVLLPTIFWRWLHRCAMQASCAATPRSVCRC